MSTQFARDFFDALAGRRTIRSVTLEVTTDEGKVQTVVVNVGDTVHVTNTLNWSGGGKVDIHLERSNKVKVVDISG